MTTPATITTARLQVIVMPNGEVICMGKTIGWVAKLGPYLQPEERVSSSRPIP